MKKVLLLILLVGCEKAHPAQAKAELILDAIQFGDLETVVKQHVESSKQASFCTDEFERALKKVETDQTPERCIEIESISKEIFAGLNDEGKLTAKIAKFSCRKSEKSCEAFSSEIYSEALRNTVWLKQVKGYKIQRTLGDEGNAVVYVELAGAFGVKRSTLKFKKISSGWFLKSGLMF